MELGCKKGCDGKQKTYYFVGCALNFRVRMSLKARSNTFCMLESRQLAIKFSSVYRLMSGPGCSKAG